MITNDGKELISKFLIGQVPTFATHLAVGCGAKPLLSNETYPNNIVAKSNLDFEIVRVPISSKGFVDDSKQFIITSKLLESNLVTLIVPSHDIKVGEQVVISNVDSIINGQYTVIDTDADTIYFHRYGIEEIPLTSVNNGVCYVIRTKLSLSAELPTDNRYEITEVGLWSAAKNTLAGQYDSRMIFTFDQSWQLHGSSVEQPPFFDLGESQQRVDIDKSGLGAAFFASTNDSLFQNVARKSRKEGPRMSNKTLLVSGTMSNIIIPTDGNGQLDLAADWLIDPSSYHIHLENINFDLTGNNPEDLLKLAFSVIDKYNVNTDPADHVKIVMEFYRNETNTENGYAKAQIYVPWQSLDSNRYFVANFTSTQAVDYTNESGSNDAPYIKFTTSSDFSSSLVRLCRIYVEIEEQDNQNEFKGHYLAFDGFRVDNLTQNPVYKMSGYSIIKNDGYSIIKSANSNNFIDFRMGLEAF